MGLTKLNQELAKRHGGKIPFVRCQLFRLLWVLGAFRRFDSADPLIVSRLVFVCKGNICRSPYSEARAAALGFSSYSFGLDTKDGNPANSTAQATALRHGLDLTDHRTRSVQQYNPNSADLLIGMEPDHVKRLELLYGRTGPRITMLGLYYHRPTPHIQDPYGRGEAYFETCFTILDQAIERLGERIRASNASLAGR